MSVYVDDMAAPYSPPHAPTRTYTMCHMIADSHDELIAMVRRIGVDPKWIQDEGLSTEHFDVAKTKRKLAVAAGAVELTSRDLVRKMREKKGGTL